MRRERETGEVFVTRVSVGCGVAHAGGTAEARDEAGGGGFRRGGGGGVFAVGCVTASARASVLFCACGALGVAALSVAVVDGVENLVDGVAIGGSG